MSIKIFGYGTFITREFYRDYRDVTPAYLPGFHRVVVHPRFDREPDYEITPADGFIYPFILKGKKEYNVRPGFWGLLFSVNDEQLARLDYYEGCGYLYNRIEVEVLLPDGSSEKCEVYYPTDQTIRSENLEHYVKYGDKWRNFIINYFPEIIKEFPQLALKDGPNTPTGTSR